MERDRDGRWEMGEGRKEGGRRGKRRVVDRIGKEGGIGGKVGRWEGGKERSEGGKVGRRGGKVG